MQSSLRRSRATAGEIRPDAALVYQRLSDPILVRRAKDGDRRALAALCERHAPKVERLARHLLPDPEDARDAAQDALARLCVKLPLFRGESAFSTWLHRLTVNACRDVAQRQVARRCVPLEEDRRVSWERGPAGEVEASELRAELGACLAQLAPAQAQVILLKDAFDYSFAEIADASGMPVGTAKCYAHRARNGLRDRLTDRLSA